MNSESVKRIRIVLGAGALVFGLSAIALIVVPKLFNELLGLVSTSDLEWSMRMTGITLVALAGNMFSHSTRGTDSSVCFVGFVMLVSAFALGILTLLIPTTWFTISYAFVGFGFSAAYLWALLAPKSNEA
jgi:mannitol-specific phosphotransferase system IIBC component